MNFHENVLDAACFHLLEFSLSISDIVEAAVCIVWQAGVKSQAKHVTYWVIIFSVNAYINLLLCVQTSLFKVKSKQV